MSSKDASIPPLPPVEQLVAEGCWMQLTALEVGVATLLLAAAWAQDCYLPNDAIALAEISRDSSWLATGNPSRDQLRQALGFQIESKGLLCSHARRVYDAMRERQTSVSAKRAAAGRSGAAAKWGQRPPPTWQMPSAAWQVPSNMANATPAPLSSALERSEFAHESKRSSASAVIASIHDGIDAQVEATLRSWRVSQSKRLLADACKQWAADGKVYGDWLAACHRIAMLPHVTPAIVEIVLGRVHTTKGGASKPLGYIIHVLGAAKGGRLKLVPYITDQPIIDKWAELEKKIADGARAHEAARALELRITRPDERPGVKHG